MVRAFGAKQCLDASFGEMEARLSSFVADEYCISCGVYYIYFLIPRKYHAACFHNLLKLFANESPDTDEESVYN